MTTNEFAGALDNQIHTPLQRAHDRRTGERVITHQNQLVLFGQFHQWRNRRHFHRGVGNSLEVQHFRVGRDGSPDSLRVRGINKAGADAVIGQAMIQHFMGGAVGGPVADNMITLFQQSEQGHGDRRHA